MLDWLTQLKTRLLSYALVEVVVELILIWLVVYLAYRFLRGTRGARIFKGGLLLLLIVGGGLTLLGWREGQFDRLSYLLDTFLIYVAFALAIVFQPELRRAMMQLGQVKLFRMQEAAGLDSMIGELTDAVKALSNNKIGAIIAIERSVGLRGIVDAGTQINGEVSSALIQTIFWPGTLLHDMGVIIREDRLIAAGVQFPMVEAEDLAQEFGARHRAAVGLSEEADCLVIVVSEETGMISLAEQGELYQRLSVETLATMLRRGLGFDRPETDEAPSDPKTPNGALADTPTSRNQEAG